MVKSIRLDEIIINSDISKEKTKFLELCARRINEAVDIWTQEHLEFDYKLAQGNPPHKLIIFGSKEYDAEIKSGGWCYISFINTNK